MGKKIITLVLAVFTLAIAAGCATKINREYNIVYPPSPYDPLFALTAIYKNDLDFLDELTLMQKIMGVQANMTFARPYGVAARGNKMYVADTNGATVYIFDFQAKKIDAIQGSANAKISMPIGVAVSSDGTVYVSDSKEVKVYAFDNKGEYVTQISEKEGLARPTGLAIDDSLGRLYIADAMGNQIHVVSLSDSKIISTIGTPGTADGQLFLPTNLAVDRRNNNLLVTDQNNFRIQTFDKDGKFISKFGQVGDANGDFQRPKGVGIDSEGHIYVADAVMNSIQVFNSAGEVLGVVGINGVRPGEFQLPAGLYIDEEDRVYITDQANQRVQVFQYFSEAWKTKHPEEYAKYLTKKKK